ncbi:transcription termination factor 2 isoform X3 [Microplitis demolitor]|uniref:transcription termination factor 2 isoform X3 n=1 Tax=Microplitis demolitor TaxID=69319 RepID=UPI00235B6CBB|nr:transcription termination factor 2 isoform X3 [Microplitis demolitor]
MTSSVLLTSCQSKYIFKRKLNNLESMEENKNKKRRDKNYNEYGRDYSKLLNNSYIIDSDSDVSDHVELSDFDADANETVEVEDNPEPSTSSFTHTTDSNNLYDSDNDFKDYEVLDEEFKNEMDFNSDIHNNDVNDNENEDEDEDDLHQSSEDNDNDDDDDDELNQRFDINNINISYDSFEDTFDPTITEKTEELLKQIEKVEKDVARSRQLIENCNLEKLPDKGERQKDILEFNESELVRLRKEYDQVLSSATANNQSHHPGSRPFTMNKLQVLHGTLLSCPSENQREKTPDGLKTALKPHQEHALAWLLWREAKKPPSGILADDMGLGKTLTMISLIVKSNEDHLDSDSDDNASTTSTSVPDPRVSTGSKVQVKGKTLVICPASLLQQWKNEIQHHCHENVLLTKIYHGTQRTNDRRLLSRYDVIITTYNLVAREFTQKSPFQPGVLSRIKWQRIILDEAHIIRNPKSSYCESVCDLMAEHRWALTGTPIHNRHDDLYSIIKFLRLSPFDDYHTFRNAVGCQSASGNQRLTTFIKTFMLRRTKEDLQNKGDMERLPDRTSETIIIELDSEERSVYNKVLAYSKSLFAAFLFMRANKAEGLGSFTYDSIASQYDRAYDDSSRKGNTANTRTRARGRPRGGRGRGRGRARGRGSGSAITVDHLQFLAEHTHDLKHTRMVWILVLILRLRQLCCHPSLIHGLLEETDINTIGIDKDDSKDIDIKKISDITNINNVDGENDENVGLGNSEDLVASNPVFQRSRKSSKVRAVMERVVEILKTKDKMIIVSQWTGFLNVIAENFRSLRDARYAMFTGAVNVKDRQSVVNDFNDPVSDTRILLLSLTAGGVGLNLTGGNVFVIAAILLERHLQSVANYLILSLAVADLLVACLVMPLGAVYEVSHEWTLGPDICDIWTSTDVLCCTASILHLVAIALDRYWSVTNVDYIHHRTAKRIGIMIAVVWFVAFLVCIAPLLGWKDPHWNTRIEVDKTCLVSQDIGYQIFATVSSFYLPLLVILILYWRILQTARKRIRRRVGQPINAQGATKTMECKTKSMDSGHAVGDALAQAQVSGGIAAAVVTVIGRPLPTISETTTTAFTTVSSNNTSPEKTSYHNGLEPEPSTMDASPAKPAVVIRKKKKAAESKRERKAAKTLSIITGAFIVCWLPFFVIAILLPVCQTCNINVYLIAFFQWLGYFNSTLNPAIYTVFSPEFRSAFKKLLCRRRRAVGRRMGVRHYM